MGGSYRHSVKEMTGQKGTGVPSVRLIAICLIEKTSILGTHNGSDFLPTCLGVYSSQPGHLNTMTALKQFSKRVPLPGFLSPLSFDFVFEQLTLGH